DDEAEGGREGAVAGSPASSGDKCDILTVRLDRVLCVQPGEDVLPGGMAALLRDEEALAIGDYGEAALQLQKAEQLLRGVDDGLGEKADDGDGGAGAGAGAGGGST